MDQNQVDRATEKLVEIEKKRIDCAFRLAIFGIGIVALLTGVLVVFGKWDKPSDVVAIAGLFTSVIGTLVGAFFGAQIGSAGREREEEGRRQAGITALEERKISEESVREERSLVREEFLKVSQRADEDRRIAQEERKKAEEDRRIAQEERKKAEEDLRNIKEIIETRAGRL